MASYKIYVVDEDNKSCTVHDHTIGYGGKPCMTFPDDINAFIVIEHPTATTYIHIYPDGELEVEEPILHSP